MESSTAQAAETSMEKAEDCPSLYGPVVTNNEELDMALHVHKSYILKFLNVQALLVNRISFLRVISEAEQSKILETERRNECERASELFVNAMIQSRDKSKWKVFKDALERCQAPGMRVIRDIMFYGGGDNGQMQEHEYQQATLNLIRGPLVDKGEAGYLCEQLSQEGHLTQAEREQVMARLRNEGNSSAMYLLLYRLSRNQDGYIILMKLLWKNGSKNLVRSLDQQLSLKLQQQENFDNSSEHQDEMSDEENNSDLREGYNFIGFVSSAVSADLMPQINRHGGLFSPPVSADMMAQTDRHGGLLSPPVSADLMAQTDRKWSKPVTSRDSEMLGPRPARPDGKLLNINPSECELQNNLDAPAFNTRSKTRQRAQHQSESNSAKTYDCCSQYNQQVQEIYLKNSETAALLSDHLTNGSLGNDPYHPGVMLMKPSSTAPTSTDPLILASQPVSQPSRSMEKSKIRHHNKDLPVIQTKSASSDKSRQEEQALKIQKSVGFERMKKFSCGRLFESEAMKSHQNNGSCKNRPLPASSRQSMRADKTHFKAKDNVEAEKSERKPEPKASSSLTNMTEHLPRHSISDNGRSVKLSLETGQLNQHFTDHCEKENEKVGQSQFPKYQCKCGQICRDAIKLKIHSSSKQCPLKVAADASRKQSTGSNKDHETTFGFQSPQTLDLLRSPEQIEDNGTIGFQVSSNQNPSEKCLSLSTEVLKTTSPKKNQFFCDECGFKSNSGKGLKIHQTKMHGNHKTSSFSAAENLDRSVESLPTGASSKKYQFFCDECIFKSDSEKGLKIHQTKMHGNHKTSSFSAAENLDRSVESLPTGASSKKYQFFCDECIFKSDSEKGLKIHQTKMNHKSSCPIAENLDRSCESLPTDFYKCNMCGFLSPSEKGLKIHKTKTSHI